MRVIVRVLTLIGDFSCVNTKLAFDTDILVKDPKTEKLLVDVEIDGEKQLLVLVQNSING